MKIRRVVTGSIGCLVLLGCGNAIPTSRGMPISGPNAPASLEISSQEALSISDGYLEQDPLGPFGVGYLEFFGNPELITDEQFLARANPLLSE